MLSEARKIGVVLSGGGARGYAHLGMLKALEERNIRPAVMSGTSAGAVVAALYSYGYSPDECFSLLAKTNFLGYIRPTIRGNGLFRINRLGEFLARQIPEGSFESLKIPLIVTATDIHSGEVVSYEAGRLIDPVLASCCLPGIFEPFRYEGRELVDGGVLNNFPVEFIETKADYLIGLHCNPFSLNVPLASTRDVMARSYLLAIHHHNIERFVKCQLLIEPPLLRNFTIFDFRKAKEMFNMAYEYASRLLSNQELGLIQITA